MENTARTEEKYSVGGGWKVKAKKWVREYEEREVITGIAKSLDLRCGYEV